MGHLSAEHFLKYLLANYAVLNFDQLRVRSLHFPKISASLLIIPFFIIGDCVYILTTYNYNHLLLNPEPTFLVNIRKLLLGQSF